MESANKYLSSCRCIGNYLNRWMKDVDIKLSFIRRLWFMKRGDMIPKVIGAFGSIITQLPTLQLWLKRIVQM